MRTTFTNLCSIREPIAGFSRSPGVVVEVSRAGGLGVMAASSYTPSELHAQLLWIEERLGDEPYGVDILLPSDAVDAPDLFAQLREQIPDEHVQFVANLLKDYGLDADLFRERLHQGNSTVASLSPAGTDELLDVVFEHPIALLANALGPPPPTMIERARQAGVPLAALVGSAEHARRQIDSGVDLLVAQGTEAGGHTGTIATTVLTPEVVAVADGRPILSAGGIASGRAMAAALALGADGVWCGSVWLSSDEDITPRWIKEKFLAAASSQAIRSRSRTGKPARQLRSPWHDAWDAPSAPPPLPMQQHLLVAKAAWSVIEESADEGEPGAQELGSFFVGQVVGGFDMIRPTREIMTDLVEECRTTIEEMARLLGEEPPSDQER